MATKSTIIRHLIFLTMVALAPLSSAWAQRTSEATEQAKMAGEGEINRQQEFFDPTRKVEKKKEAYQFAYDWRLEVGYAQNQQRSTTNIMNPYTHGIKLGATVDFLLPYHFSVQTGLALGITYGQLNQSWRSMDAESVQKEYIRHGINQYYLEIPARVYYNQKLWKELNLFFFTGPKLQIGLAEMDWIPESNLHLSEKTLAWLQQEGVHTETYNRYSKDLYRTNIQWGLGGGLEWAQYRLVAGYDFGLNNLAKRKPTKDSHMWQWGWYVSFAYKL